MSLEDSFDKLYALCEGAGEPSSTQPNLPTKGDLVVHRYAKRHRGGRVEYKRGVVTDVTTHGVVIKPVHSPAEYVELSRFGDKWAII